MPKIKIIECPRDAMQSIKEFIPTDLKVKYLQSLVDVGFDTIDIGSFVSSAVIPQLSDTAEVINKINLSNNTNLYLDSLIAPTALNSEFYEQIYFLAPFGSGNSEPKFAIENLKVINSNLVGKKHIKSILIGSDGTKLKTFTWNAKDSVLEPFLLKENKKKINIAGKIRMNEWQGKKDIEFIIEDISVS